MCKYQSPEAEAKNQFARWYCAVSSPFTQGGTDLGDVYAKDVKERAVLVEVEGKPVSPEVRAVIAVMGEKPDPLPPVGADGTSGQDRESYSDTQDRKSYSTD